MPRRSSSTSSRHSKRRSIMNSDDETKSKDAHGEDGTSCDIDVERWNPRKFLKEMREKAAAASFVEHDESMTLDLLITQCHGLVITNQEIWERCKPFYCTTITTADSGPDKYMFYRVGYLEVKASTSSYYSDRVKFESTSEVTKSSFEIPSLPARLECLVVRPQPSNILPDYEEFLERLMMLVDEVLPGVLLEFKAFLEDYQIALGAIDAWLMQTDDDVFFLQKEFNVTIPGGKAAWQELGSRFSSLSTCQQDLISSICSRCGSSFYHHSQRESDGWVYCDYGQQSGCFPLANGMISLGEYTCPGTIDVKFRLEIPSDRNRLIRFLEFARNSESPVA